MKGLRVSENLNLDLKLIADNCGIFSTLESEVIIAKIDELRIKYSSDELVAIYNYMLSCVQQPDVLMYVIRCTDMYRHPSSLEFLVDILLLKNYSNIDEELKEKYINVRVMCAKAIANQKNTEVVSSLLYCLNNKNEHYKVRLAVYLRETAVSALGLLGDTRALEPIVSILETKQGIIDKFTFLKERAIEAVIKMGFGDNERVFRALKNSLTDESTQVRINSIEALMDSEHPKAYEVIKKCLQDDKDEEVKKNALIALYNMSDRGILDEVISSSEYSDKLKMEAVEILNEYENDIDEEEE